MTVPKSPMGGVPKAKIEKFNLAKAREFLEGVDPERRRNLRRSMIQQFARDMLAGNWYLHTAALGVNELGRSVDGNHRMEAFVLAATEGVFPYEANPHLELEFWVVRGIAARPEVENTIDTGKSRQYRDVLQIRGKANANNVASVARRLYAWEMGNYYAGSSNAGGRGVSFPELDAFLAKVEDEVDAAADFAVANYIGARLTPTNLALAYIVLHRLDDTLATVFMHELATGDRVPSTSQMGLLRSRLERQDHADGRERNTSSNQAKRMAYVFQSWNHLRAGDEPTKPQLPKGGVTGKNFPIPR